MRQQLTGNEAAMEAANAAGSGGAAKAAARMFLSTCLREYVSRLRADAPLYAFIGIYSAAGLILLWLSGSLKMQSYSAYFVQWPRAFLLVMPAMAILFDGALLIHRFDGHRRLAFSRGFSPRRVASLLAGMSLLLGLMFFQGTFTSIKNILPVLQGGFRYDRVQADIDAWLHFGTDPWRWLHAVSGSGWVLAAVEFNYNVLWFALCFGTLFFVATSPAADRIRRRYLALFFFVWIFCGNVLAGIFLSAGPAFYGAVSGDPTRFAELSASLATSHWGNSAAAYQSYLWNLYDKGVPGLGGGISAFPSVHVGLVTLNALFIYEYSRRLGALAFAYVALVLASSVYLGWHYAIDGYVSIVVVSLGYFAVSAWTRKPRVGLAAAGGMLNGNEPAPLRNSAG